MGVDEARQGAPHRQVDHLGLGPRCWRTAFSGPTAGTWPSFTASLGDGVARVEGEDVVEVDPVGRGSFASGGAPSCWEPEQASEEAPPPRASSSNRLGKRTHRAGIRARG